MLEDTGGPRGLRCRERRSEGMLQLDNGGVFICGVNGLAPRQREDRSPIFATGEHV